MNKTLSRRRELIVRILTYVVMTTSVITAVILGLFIVLGYSVDEKTGRAEQGGLLQFRSFPSGANVTIDGAVQPFKTTNNANVKAGQHTVGITRDNYRGWSRDFALSSGELLWLNARLVPKTVTTNEAWQFDAIHNTKASPDKKRYAVIEKANTPLLKIFDLNDQDKPKASQLKIPDSVIKPPAETDIFSISEWDFGSRYLLVSHTSGQTTQWLRLDRTNPANTVNITTTLGFKFREAHFVGGSGNVLYALGDDGTLRKLDLGSKVVSSPIASEVREFQLYKNDRMIIVSQKTDFQTVSIYKQGAKNVTKLKTYVGVTPPVRVALSSYFKEDYVAVSHGKIVDIIKNPTEEKTNIASITLGEKEASWVYFSNNGQFVVAQNGDQLASYDLQRKEKFRFSIPANPGYVPARHLEWLDDYRLWSDAGGKLSIIEFDGTNTQTISDLTEGYSVTLSDDGKRLYSISTNTTTKKPVLQSSVMVLD